MGATDFLRVLPLTDLPDGERVFLEVEGQAVVLLHLAGKLFAVGDVCTHDNAPLGDGEVQDGQVICPRHGARFDLTNGKAVRLPAVRPIPTYAVRVSEDGWIEISRTPKD
jgi:3-phenylpropionate/trans-cinnamate dioxygenase ferredoxin subunit